MVLTAAANGMRGARISAVSSDESIARVSVSGGIVTVTGVPGAVGVARTFAYGGEHGRSMSESVQHFYDKLLRLRDLMNTETARRLAEERHAFLVAYLEEFRKETEE